MDFALIMGAKYAVLLAPSMSGLSQDPVVQKIAAFAFIALLIIVLTWIVTAFLNGILKSLKLVGKSFSRWCFWFVERFIGCSYYHAGCWSLGRKFASLETIQIYPVLLPYAPLATELSKDAASEAFHQITSGGGVTRTSPKPMDESEETELRPDHSTKNPFINS